MSFSFIETHFSDWKNTDLDENTNNNVERLLIAMEILTQIGQLFADTCQDGGVEFPPRYLIVINK